MGTKREYQRYLKSDTWKRVSRLARERANYKCEVCREDGPIHVHHHRYPKRREDDNETNLIVLCELCHGKAHEHSWLYYCALIFELGRPPNESEISAMKERFQAKYRTKIERLKVMEPCKWQEFAL